MSKFAKKLEAAARGETAPLGFGPRRGRTPIPTMLIVARVSNGEVEEARTAAEAGADVVLISLTGAGGVPETLKALGDTPWGADLEGAAAEQWKTFMELGCDFVVFSPETAPAALLGPDELGRVVRVDASLSEMDARALESVPVDALLLAKEPSGEPLTVARCMAYRRLAGLTRRPLLLEAPASGREADLEPLRDAGVLGLLVSADVERIKALREAVAALPPRRRAMRERREAMLPMAAPAQPAYEEEEEEEEEG